MGYRCSRCREPWSDALAAAHSYRCIESCGGELVNELAGWRQTWPEVPLADLPYPVALTATRLAAALSGENVVKSLLALKDFFEVSIKYFAVLLLVDYLRSPAKSTPRNQSLIEKMVRPSLGVWVNTVVANLSHWLSEADLGKSEADGTHSGIVPDPAGLFISSSAGRGKPQPTALLKRSMQFVEYRNDVLGHGALRRDSVYRADLEGWLPLISELARGVAGLRQRRLCLVTDLDRCQEWMGPAPGETTQPGEFRREQIGHFVTRSDSGSAIDLFPFICYLPDRTHEKRLHFYDSVYRYQATRKELSLLEYDNGFKQNSAEPAAALEEKFTAELLATAFRQHRGRMEIIEGRVANFDELLVSHSEIIGRKTVIEFVRRFVGRHDRGLLVIEAEPGKGKTALMAHLVEHVFGQHAPRPVHFFYRRTAGITDPDVCVSSLYRSLLEAHDLSEAEESRRQNSPEEMFHKFTNLLASQIAPRLNAQRPQLIFIDALDEATPTTTGRTAFDRVPENIPAGVYIIVTTRPVSDRTALARRANVTGLSLDSPDLVDENVRDGAAYVERELLTIDVAREVREEIARVGAGNFLVLKLMCSQIRSSLEQGQVRDFLREIATRNGFDQLGFIYAEFWNRIAAGATREDLRVLCDVAGVFVYCRAAVSADMVCRALDLSAGDWEYALRHLAEYLTPVIHDETPDADTFYRLYHESFADFLRTKTSTVAARLQSRLADYCLQWDDLPAGYGRGYAIRFAPLHLRESCRWDDLETLLTNIFFLEAKVGTGLVFQLADDFAAALERLPPDRLGRKMLELLDEALRRDIHSIARHCQDNPQGLFQTFWNYGWWYDAPESAPYYLPLTKQYAAATSVPPKIDAPPAPDKRPLANLVDRIQKAFRGTAKAATPPHVASATPVPPERPPERRAVDPHSLCALVERWLAEKQSRNPDGWLRALRPLPNRLGSPLVAVLRGHEIQVVSVCYSPDGRRIVTGSYDKTVRIWDARDGAELSVLRGHEGGVESVCISPDGTRVASGSRDGTIRIWDIDTAAPLAEWRAEDEWIHSVAYAPDGRRLASGSNRSTVRIWDTVSGAQLGLLSGPWGWVNCVSFSPDGARLVVASDQLQIWDAINGTLVLVLRGHKFSVKSASFSPDGRQVVSASYDKTVQLWDAVTGVPLLLAAQSWEPFNSAKFSHDGQKVVACSADSLVRIRDAAGAQSVILRGHDTSVNDASFSPDDRRVASVGDDGTLRVWKAQGDTRLPALTGHEERIDYVAFSPDGQWIATASLDRTVGLWDARCGIMRTVLRGHRDSINSICFSPDSRLLASASGALVHIWDVATAADLRLLWGHAEFVAKARFSSDGLRIVTGSNDKTIRIWDPACGQQLAMLSGHTETVSAVCFSPSGRHIASGSLDGTVRLWDASTGAQLTDLDCCEKWVIDLCFSPDGRRVVGRCADASVLVIDTETGECLEIMPGVQDIVSVARGAEIYPWRMVAQTIDTIVVSARDGSLRAAFPQRMDDIAAHPLKPCWAAIRGKSLYLLELENSSPS